MEIITGGVTAAKGLKQLRQQQKLNTKAVQMAMVYKVKFHVLQLALLQQMW